ncbi:MAG: hypothetical protein N2504_07550, partial [candidate division WOR-3 bacterium]|nr:hypothetical protein [candidate division WOR-3 bacterium]
GYVFQKKKEEFRFEKTWTCTNAGCFEGMLVHRYVVSKIGYPLKQLFFIGDDTYFGYLVSKVTNVIYIRDICFVKKIKSSTNLNPIKVYLVYRNIVGYLARVISKDKRRYYVFTFSLVSYNFLKYMIRLEFDMLYFMLRGFLDGLREKWGYEKILMSRHKKM